MIVVDTNVIAYLHLPGEHTPLAERLVRRERRWCAPGLWRSEFANILAGYLRRKAITVETALATADAAERRIGGREYRVPLAHVLELVARSECTAYDCEFVALAIALNVPLITQDQRIVRQFPAVARTMEEVVG